MSKFAIFLFLLFLVVVPAQASVNTSKYDMLCSMCSTCDSKLCPPSEGFPQMTGFDDALIVGALQSDFVPADDRGVYSMSIEKGNTYYGWESQSGSTSGYHRYRNSMDKCSNGRSFLTVDRQGQVSLRSLKSLNNLTEADWKTFNPPLHLNHHGFKFLVSGSKGKCLTVFEGLERRIVGVDNCNFEGLNLGQLFAFKFHYHNAFCCCGMRNS